MAHIVELDAYWRSLVEAYSNDNIEGAAVVCFPKVPLPAINHVADINVNEQQILPFITQAEHYFKRNGLGSACFRVSPSTCPSNFAEALKKQGYCSVSKQSVMVYKGNEPKNLSENGVRIQPVTDNSHIEEFDRLLLGIFEMPSQWMEGFNDFTKQSMRVGWQFFLAYFEGKPVGVSALYSSCGVGGIYDVGTLEEFRGRGIGSILTLHALGLSFDSCNKVHTLQAESGGSAERLYHKLGFSVDHFVEFYSNQL